MTHDRSAREELSRPLPPYSYVPGHGQPHPVTDPAGHSFGHRAEPPIGPEELARLPVELAARQRALASILAANREWLFAIELFNEGFCWEAHEAWELFWNVLGRTTPEARGVQGLIHLAAAGVKIREGRPQGVARHVERARELLSSGVEPGGPDDAVPGVLGLDASSVAGVLQELAAYRPECWHTSRAPVVSVVAAKLRMRPA